MVDRISLSCDNIIIRNGIPLAINESLFNPRAPEKELLRLIFQGWSRETIYDHLKEIILETGEYFDYDNMRGILLQSRESESSLMGRKPKRSVYQTSRGTWQRELKNI